jgi:hypothetical protein
MVSDFWKTKEKQHLHNTYLGKIHLTGKQFNQAWTG